MADLLDFQEDYSEDPDSPDLQLEMEAEFLPVAPVAALTTTHSSIKLAAIPILTPTTASPCASKDKAVAGLSNSSFAAQAPSQGASSKNEETGGLANSAVASQASQAPPQAAPSKNEELLTSAVNAAQKRAAEAVATNFGGLRRMADHFRAGLEAAAETKDPELISAANEIQRLTIQIINGIGTQSGTPRAAPRAIAPLPTRARLAASQPASRPSFAQALASSHEAKDHTNPPYSRALPRRPATTAPRRADTRLMVRLPESSPLWHADLFCIQQKILPLLPKELKAADFQRTKTGLAIAAASSTDALTIALKAQEIASALNASEAGPQVPWRTIRMQGVPQTLQTITDEGSLTSQQVTYEQISEEITSTLQAKPLRLRWSPDALIVNFVASDLQYVPAQISLFCSRVTCTTITSQARITQCGKCWDYHRPEHCRRALRCKTCGSMTHTSETHSDCTPTGCYCPPQCCNCHGSHPADSGSCPLRPRRQKQTHSLIRPTVATIRSVRMANDKTRHALSSCQMHRRDNSSAPPPSAGTTGHRPRGSRGHRRSPAPRAQLGQGENYYQDLFGEEGDAADEETLPGARPPPPS